MTRFLFCTLGLALCLSTLLTGCKKKTPLNPKLGVNSRCEVDTQCETELCLPDNAGRRVCWEPTPFSPFELCRILVTSLTVTDHENAPNGPLCRQGQPPSAKDFAADAFEVVCRPGSSPFAWARQLLDAAKDGRVQLDLELAHRCLQESRELKRTHPGHVLLREDRWQALKDGVCRDFINGAVNEGRSCLESWECVEGTGCYSKDPFTPGTLLCLKPGGEQDACSPAWYPCAEHLSCHQLVDGYLDTYACVVPAKPGEACSREVPCESGLYCSGGLCVSATLGRLEIGEPCLFNSDCRGECVGCYAAQAGVGKTCNYLGGEGAYCEKASDCVDDLGCANNLCTTALEGERCFGGTESRCHRSLECVSSCWAQDFDEAGCATLSPCRWDAARRWCEPIPNGPLDYTCETLPDSGDCLYGYCAAGFYCHPTELECRPVAGRGEACDSTGATAGLCAPPYDCSSGTCALPCAFNEDCREAERCNVNLDPPTCEPAVAGSCKDEQECSDAEYCASCEFVHHGQTCMNSPGCQWQDAGHCSRPCDLFHDYAEACDAHPGCAWDTWLCRELCASLRDDRDACEGEAGCRYDEQASGLCVITACPTLQDEGDCNAEPACRWDAVDEACDEQTECWGMASTACAAEAACAWVEGWCRPVCWEPDTVEACEAVADYCHWTWLPDCEPEVDCLSVADRAACEAEATCHYVDQSSCAPLGDTGSFNCVAKLSVGEPCFDHATCESGRCELETPLTRRCAQNVPGPHDTFSLWFVRMAFIFGLVAMGSRARARRP